MASPHVFVLLIIASVLTASVASMQPNPAEKSSDASHAYRTPSQPNMPKDMVQSMGRRAFGTPSQPILPFYPPNSEHNMPKGELSQVKDPVVFGINPSSKSVHGSNPTMNPMSDESAPPTIPTYGSTPLIPSYPGGGTTIPTPYTPDNGHGSSIPTYGSPSPASGTCKFWSSHSASWPDILSTISTISTIFGKSASSMFDGHMTLLEALETSKEDPYSSLLRQATASLLNSYAYINTFPFSPQDVKAKFNAALATPKAAAAQAAEFAEANGQ
eukprot:Gb_40194 [translate_table: standard]